MCHNSRSKYNYVLAYLLNKSIQIVQYRHLKSRHQSDQAYLTLAQLIMQSLWNY